jgi:hypothetical protein
LEDLLILLSTTQSLVEAAVGVGSGSSDTLGVEEIPASKRKAGNESNENEIVANSKRVGVKIKSVRRPKINVVIILMKLERTSQ